MSLKKKIKLDSNDTLITSGGETISLAQEICS